MLLRTSAPAVAVTALALAALLGGSAALAAPGECRFIQSRKERNACYDREAAAKAAAQQQKKSAGARMSDTIDQMQVENDRLNSRLQGICRGC
jgi:hypothetical protein